MRLKSLSFGNENTFTFGFLVYFHKFPLHFGTAQTHIFLIISMKTSAKYLQDK